MNEREVIYQKKTIDSAINIIMTKMDELRGANENDKRIMRRRWIWELIQNANDCANGREVSIWIYKNENELVFSHNGSIFTYSNLVDLITQISSKRINSEEMTGKFGTGFISTHLISEIVKVKGLYHSTPASVNYKRMCLDIDRSGKNEQEIKESIMNAISMLDTIDMSDNIGFSLESSEPKTSFIYDLTRTNSLEIQEAIKSGCNDLDMSIPLVLAFVNTIKEVHCEGVTYRRNNKASLIEDKLEIIDVVKTNDDKNESTDTKKILVCYDKDNEVSVATFIEKRNDRYYTSPVADIPKLFCSFPLIGTEDFSFPIVINSPNLKVLQERNHIQEGAATNQEIIKIAISLYKDLLEYVCQHNWNNLFNLCYIKHSKESVFQKGIFNTIQSIYQIQPIVDVQHKSNKISKESLYKESNGKNSVNILIPSMDKPDLNDILWDLINCLNIKAIPTKDSYKYWMHISPNNRLTLQATYDSLLKGKTINDLCGWFTDKDEMMPWLNRFYSLWLDSSDKRNFLATAIVPNQDDQFIEITKVSVDDNIDELLKEILSLLGTDIKKKLLHKNIRLSEGIEIETINNEYIANKINDHVRKQLSDESSNTTKRTQEVQVIFNKLTDWFLKNPDLAKPLFKDIYDKQYHQNILSSPEETARRLGLATTFENEMRANNLELEQIKIILKESGRLLKMFEDGEISISEDARKLFQHISSKSPYAKEKIDSLIKRSIKSVYEELSDNPLYSVDDTLEEWIWNNYSTTVFKARKLDENRNIRVVIRPSDDDKIIFFEDAELEALDDTNYELWTDNEKGDVRLITLGDLLKTTGATAIPLRKIL
ncbi:sacsin N-terminal ATP-binding-like domain-containing protein [Paenibacillus sp. TC-CSREp1]|uniref:sacsin N-terminal ATP-binding-like domain-containing protein n=1 Tax=Paenibacillus sp. TC-CSREp1 TaxID=3410089 RepID=UPI003CFDBD1F